MQLSTCLRAYGRFLTLRRVQRKLLVLFIAMATLDSLGKIVERHEPTMRRVAQLAGHFGISVRTRPEIAGNFDIFRNSPRHLLAGDDLYAPYFNETQDRFKYSPTFALLFTPLAFVPWPVALLVWQLINALALFYALTRLLDDKRAPVALGIVALEVWRSMQNSQSNALVATAMVFAFVALEQRKHLTAALWIVLGTIIKIFPLAAGVFALPTRDRWRMAGLTTVTLAGALAAPALVIGPAGLAAQYRSWFEIERQDAQAHMQSLMALFHLVPGLDAIPNVAIQLLGIGVLLLPLALRADRWSDREFRLQMLASVLLFVVLFNPQAERASYVIAFTGVAIWYVTSARTALDKALLAIALVCVPIASMFIPGGWIRTPVATVVRLVVPCLAIWIVLQSRMLATRAPVAYKQSDAADPRRSPSGA